MSDLSPGSDTFADSFIEARLDLGVDVAVLPPSIYATLQGGDPAPELRLVGDHGQVWVVRIATGTLYATDATALDEELDAFDRLMDARMLRTLDEAQHDGRQLLTITHPRWPEFCGYLAEAVHHDGQCRGEIGGWAEPILQQAFPDVAVPETMQWLEYAGGFCDCSILTEIAHLDLGDENGGDQTCAPW